MSEKKGKRNQSSMEKLKKKICKARKHEKFNGRGKGLTDREIARSKKRKILIVCVNVKEGVH